MMEARDFDELAGRIEGVGEALLHLTAMLEVERVIDGPRLSEAWRRARRPNVLPVLETTRHTLQELATALDNARSSRQSQVRR